ncbi:phospho-N-acetylmuramoyl-pentapeptide-transferase [Leptolyngbya sp. 'hensonii']|uniref:phospho-N-acetylmuramoyl-pentapeptide- transferase n=1 Tax=Leptolyngbya sp. 'hensonii' TaxID=1922337 RepID=UPI00095021A0|nr:phospho-N-acetylmuramoyl-pentapeptide-transferase [Leptolyngbya sp. 'hensonii']OLP19159.1 phospho-N-acetylmuramoyl-pentapeptide-transferase [Leptolyngbya sp. 'hensonii']
MDAKFYPGKTLKLTGTILFLLLCLGLGSTALMSDWFTGRHAGQFASLTLPLVVCALMTGCIGYWAVPILRALKAGQVIREDGPQAHLKKAGTPTMGGIFFIPPAIAVAVSWSGFSPEVMAVSAMTLAYAAIGWLDDSKILWRKSNQGISPRTKLLLQWSVAALFCIWLASSQPAGMTTVSLPFGFLLPLGFLFWPLAWFVPVAESNATNLTDGVDGLAAGVGAIVLLGLGVLAYPAAPGLMVFAACLSGAFLGFLVHNRNPAQVFMGNTGSLALGGALAGVALLSNTLWALLIAGGIFFVETLSVIAQVGYYKATKGPDGKGKRLFKMAPFHHHLELSGWSETQVVGVFYTVTGILTLLCVAIH